MHTIGSDISYTSSDDNLYQGHDPICAIKCQEIILRDYGIQVPIEELVQYSKEQGWYIDKGTPRKHIGKLLEICEVDCHIKKNADVYDLINELKDGHRIIVSVDYRELQAEPGSKEYEFYSSFDKANHALIVTSIKIDLDNPNSATVVLTDPANGSILEYEFNHFAHAWKDSNCYMVATDQPAPYQYNAEEKCMELSNFATDYTIKEFPFHNEFSDIYEIDKLGYVPYYNNGHLENFITALENNDIMTLNDLFNFNDVNLMQDNNFIISNELENPTFDWASNINLTEE